MKPVINSSSFLSVLFFVAIVASMVFLVVNLFVAVITTAFMNFTVDEEGEKGQPHFMGKLDPAMEETQVNMIMGATLVIEDTMIKDKKDSVGAHAHDNLDISPEVTDKADLDHSDDSSVLVVRGPPLTRDSSISAMTSTQPESMADENLYNKTVVNSIIAMQLFGGSHLVGKDGDSPRWNFDTFGRSFLTLLQVITGDQWSSITYDAVDAAKPHWFMVPFLILNFIVGQYVLLNLFIAVILENFSISEEEAYQLQLAQIIAIPKELDIYEKIEEVGVRAFGQMDQLENVSNVKLRMFLGLDDRKNGDECVGFYLVYPDGVLPLQEGAARGIPGGGVLMPRWIDKTFAAMDIAGVGKQPVTDASAQAAIFFILYVYVGSLFVIRLFVGVLVEQFQRNNGTEILTESQKSWVDLEKFILLLKPLKTIPRPRFTVQAWVYDFCRHPYFSTGVSIAIVLNLVLLLVSPRKEGVTSQSFEVIEIIFLAIFTLEAVIKVIGLRQYYFLRPQGMFELLILVGSIVAYFFAKGYHSIIQAGRIFRMMRVLRFVHLNRGIYTVYQTFRASLRPLGQIFFLMFMIYFIFAIVARQLFGGVRYGPAMTSFSNFRSFGSATLLLFQIMSGDDWHLTMTDCMVSKPFCAERISPTTGHTYSDCGSVAGAAFFFITLPISSQSYRRDYVLTHTNSAQLFFNYALKHKHSLALQGKTANGHISTSYYAFSASISWGSDHCRTNSSVTV
ncbi:hypothetical protein PHYBOEH_000688 [Phytophthora boehmeriae]|uniref:Calcium-channel protein CCH1 n=1 Tax=Phytophthora boehmeriae TaxID=109152 RepID=A0A8T1WZ03_9STRA|nr:hypothetical protein PHYBOEH_000688 [Phytophthora boehmeriae]